MSDLIARVHPVETIERYRDHNWQLEGYQSDGLPASLNADDVVRFKIGGADGAAPTLDIDSVALPTGTFTANATTNVLTSAGHTLVNGQRVKLSSTGALPTGLSASIVYYVVGVAGNDFQVSLTSGGAAVDFSTAGTGTLTYTRIYSRVVINDLGVSGTTPFDVTVELHRDEVNLLTAETEYEWEASVVMPTQNNRIFPFGMGTFDVDANPAGDLGTT